MTDVLAFALIWVAGSIVAAVVLGAFWPREEETIPPPQPTIDMTRWRR